MLDHGLGDGFPIFVGESSPKPGDGNRRESEGEVDVEMVLRHLGHYPSLSFRDATRRGLLSTLGLLVDLAGFAQGDGNSLLLWLARLDLGLDV
jgi:hypothetical protein